MPTILKVLILVAISTATAKHLPGASEDHRVWPTQRAPRAVMRTTNMDTFERVRSPQGCLWSNPHQGPTHVLAQSLAGLAAKAVNENRHDELVWIDLSSGSYPRWFDRTVENLGIEVRGPIEPWDLLQRYIDNGLVDGYVLYRFGSGEPSINVATVIAGLKNAAMISEGQEERAVAMGLRRIADVRDKDEAWAFERYRDRLNPAFALAQNPNKPNSRDIAIAHNMMVIFGMDAPTEDVFKWLRPMAPIIGWNHGDEGRTVAQMSRYGHTLMPADWSMNIPVMSAGAHAMAPSKSFRTFDPRKIDWNDKTSAVAFLMSDGDNIQWMQNNFVCSTSFWSNESHGDYPIGWGLPYSELDEMAPVIIEELKRSQPADSTPCLNLGYYYPDLLGEAYDVEQRQDILKSLAHRAGYHLQRHGAGVLMFLCKDVLSDDAQEAYRVLVAETEGLAGIITLQYAPYDGGEGRIFWYENADGIEIPVITSAYTTWANSSPNHRRTGNPSEIIELINSNAEKLREHDEPFFACTIVHVWSRYLQRDGEIIDQHPHGRGERGMSPLTWVVDDLADDIMLVSPEELIWRLRMQRNPEQTRRAIELLGSDN